jgi:hypothetical protein
MAEENKHEEIMKICLEALGTNAEEQSCANAETAIGYLCSEEYNDDFPALFQNALEVMTLEQFNRIKKLNE